MSDKINDGGPVFPHIDTDEPTAASYTSKPGMTLRDWFAGQALLGLWANSNKGTIELAAYYDQCASACYQMADNMLVERKKDLQ